MGTLMSFQLGDENVECSECSEMHPIGVLEDGLCPHCTDKELDDSPIVVGRADPPLEGL